MKFCQTWAGSVCALLGVVLVLQAGCSRAPFKNSGLPGEFTEESFLKKLGEPQGLSITGFEAGTGGTRDGSHEEERQYRVRLTSGDGGELLGKLKAAVEGMIFDRKGVIYHTGTVAPDAGKVRDFDFRYQMPGIEGIVRVYSAPVSSNEVRLMIYCYEHARGR